MGREKGKFQEAFQLSPQSGTKCKLVLYICTQKQPIRNPNLKGTPYLQIGLRTTQLAKGDFPMNLRSLALLYLTCKKKNPMQSHGIVMFVVVQGKFFCNVRTCTKLNPSQQLSKKLAYNTIFMPGGEECMQERSVSTCHDYSVIEWQHWSKQLEQLVLMAT